VISAKTSLGNQPRRQSESGPTANKFGLFLVLLIPVVGTIGFTAYEAIRESYAVEAGMLYAVKNGWDEPNGQNIANVVANASGAIGLTALAVSRYCGCPQRSGIATTGSPPPCANQPLCTGGTPPGQYVEINAALTPMLAKFLGVPRTFSATSTVLLNE
jgi:hypothetical protein